MPETPKEVRLSPRAANDLEGIWLYTFETWSLEQAEIYHRSIIARLERLAKGELDGTDAGHIRARYRKLTVGSHIAFYRETDFGVEIIRILHQAMDFDRHF